MNSSTKTIFNDRFHYYGFWKCDCVCELEIVESGESIVVIVTEPDDNQGTSVTNMAERLAMMVCGRFGIDLHRLVWIEHYPPDPPSGLRGGRASWDLVTFKLADRKLVNPNWRPMTDQDWSELGLEPRQ